jgi:protein tyrosine/serine phosphatase
MPASETAITRPIAGIPNFHIVHPFLIRGGRPTPEGLKNMKAAGVRTVIDLRIAPKTVAKERQAVQGLGMRFINLPMSSEPPTQKQIETFLHTARDPASQPVYVNCEHGADRTGTMVGIYREQFDGWTFDRAYREMLRYGFTPAYHKLTATVKRYAIHNSGATGTSVSTSNATAAHPDGHLPASH